MTRGASQMRSTRMTCSNSTSESSTIPEMGAAEEGLRGARQRNMALAGQQAGCRVEADPTGTGQIDLAPGMQIREVMIGARRTIERLHIRDQLNEIAGREARRSPRWRSNWTSSHEESRQEPELFSRVSSGVCTPGSMRIR